MARRLFLNSQERLAEMDSDGFVVLLRQAVAADAQYLPAVIAYLDHIAFRDDLVAQYQRELRGKRDPFSRCVALVLQAPNGYPAAAAPGLLALERSDSATACSKGYLGYLSFELTPSRIWLPRGLGYLERALELQPEAVLLWIRRGAVLHRLGRFAESREVLLEGLRYARHPLLRLPIYQHLIIVFESTGELARMRALQRALAAAVERDGRPGIRFVHPDYIGFRASEQPAPAWERLGKERVRLAEAAASGGHEWGAHRTLGANLSDAGRPREALPHLERAVRIADSSGVQLIRLDSYRFRGRTLAKLGRFEEAERDLFQAIAIGKAIRSPYLLAEAYHNLAHVYEGVGRMQDAARAANDFIALTRSLQHAQPRMMSLHDAGIIRWKAGWPAAANAAFGEMVSVAGEQERGYYWSGEYFERIGDLPRALEHFRLGALREVGERSLNLGGMARVYRALGQLDSAEAAARAHDQAMSNQLSVPLLPPILAAAGRSSEAIETSRSWARKQVAQGNLQGAAMATIALAELLLDAGNPRQALVEARTADSLARRVNLTDQLIHARRIEGRSRWRLGEAAGLATLRDAAALAEQHPTSDGTLLTQLALAEALANAKQVDEALLAFERAARSVEAVASRIDRDLERSRFREHQLTPFEGAMEVLLGQETIPARLALLASWSQRRKAASLALAAGGATWGGRRGPPRLLTLEGLRQRLGPRSALVDFLTVREKSAAMVVTAQRAELIALPLSPDSLSALAEQLRRPLVRAYAGRLDLARAPFDLAAAHALHAALLAPLDSLLRGVDHLFIVPDGPLHYLPFDALVSRLPTDAAGGQGYRTAAFAVERFEIELLPSAQFLPKNGGRPSPSQRSPLRVLVVQREAPGGAEEVAGIRAAWPAGAVTVLDGDAATETSAVEAAARFGVLHFATHAQADDREPLASHLRLAADERNDGFLHLGEIAALRRPARLVVLSACETLSGRLYRGEGLMGLARAFLSGGAEAVVATQWPVGPSTAELMGEFHRGFAAGEQPAAALRRARLALRHQAATAHPFFWGSFVLVRGASRAGSLPQGVTAGER